MRKAYLIILLPLILFVSIISVSCENDGNADENFTESFSGSFQSGPMNTDTNDDGAPASVATLSGTSTFGPVTIESVNEFMLIEPTGECAEGDLEFSLLRGNFIKRITDTGELLFGTWQAGTSCFDPETKESTTTQSGVFSGGTGKFENATGPVEITFTSVDLASVAEEGFRFGGTSGTGMGILVQ